MYTPSRVPPIENLEELRRFVEQELHYIAQSLNETTALDLRPVAREPDKVRDGMIVYADGVNFDPGAGEGVYSREGGAWVKL